MVVVEYETALVVENALVHQPQFSILESSKVKQDPSTLPKYVYL